MCTNSEKSWRLILALYLEPFQIWRCNSQLFTVHPAACPANPFRASWSRVVLESAIASTEARTMFNDCYLSQQSSKGGRADMCLLCYGQDQLLYLMMQSLAYSAGGAVVIRLLNPSWVWSQCVLGV